MKELKSFVLIFSLLFGFTAAQTIFGFDLSNINPFAPSKPLDEEFQTRRYRCDADLTFGVSKSCVCIIKVVRKKGGIFRRIGCIPENSQDDIMLEVNAVYNFTTISIVINDIIGNTCPIGTDEDFVEFVSAVQRYQPTFSKPCPFPMYGRYETVDADFDSKLVQTLKPILPSSKNYNAYVRVYRSSNNRTLAFQTLYGSTPSNIPFIGSFFG